MVDIYCSTIAWKNFLYLQIPLENVYSLWLPISWFFNLLPEKHSVCFFYLKKPPVEMRLTLIKAWRTIQVHGEEKLFNVFMFIYLEIGGLSAKLSDCVISHQPIFLSCELKLSSFIVKGTGTESKHLTVAQDTKIKKLKVYSVTLCPSHKKCCFTDFCMPPWC